MPTVLCKQNITMHKTLTSAQRYNKRMDDIWENARRNGALQSECLHCKKYHTRDNNNNKICQSCIDNIPY